MKYFWAFTALVLRSRAYSASHDAERTMTKMTFIAAALVAAAAYTTEASAARSNAASRHIQPATATNTVVDCVRAPHVGAYATAPYTVPPCMPNAAN
jgi:hypothetical protein